MVYPVWHRAIVAANGCVTVAVRW